MSTDPERDACLAKLSAFSSRAPWTPDLRRIYVSGLRDITTEWLERGMDRAIRTRTYRPSPAELRADCATEMDDVRGQEGHYHPCAACADTPGWCPTVIHRWGLAHAAVKRCACWLDWAARVRAIPRLGEATPSRRDRYAPGASQGPSRWSGE